MSLEIVDIKYIEDSKVIGFINGNRLGVCVFEKSEDNKYILNTLQVINYQTTYNQFLIHYGENLERAIEIISTGEDISKVKITVNNKYNVIQDLDTKKPSMTIFNKNQINININDDKINYYLNFFDLDGKEIKDSNI